MTRIFTLAGVIAILLSISSLQAQAPRPRDLGVPFSGTPAKLNAITDVPGLEVGWYSQNGNGEMTGTTWIEESGFLDGPVLITNTHSVSVVRDAYIEWQVRNKHPSATNNLGEEDWSGEIQRAARSEDAAERRNEPII